MLREIACQSALGRVPTNQIELGAKSPLSLAPRWRFDEGEEAAT